MSQFKVDPLITDNWDGSYLAEGACQGVSDSDAFNLSKALERLLEDIEVVRNTGSTIRADGSEMPLCSFHEMSTFAEVLGNEDERKAVHDLLALCKQGGFGIYDIEHLQKICKPQTTAQGKCH